LNAKGEFVSVGYKPPAWDSLRKATAFGHETAIDPYSLPELRLKLVQRALELCRQLAQEAVDDNAKMRLEFIDIARRSLEAGLGDTQWPINEITLWDYASSIAALFKASIAKSIVEGKIPAPTDAAPIDMYWRFLSVRLNWHHFVTKAPRMADLIARQKLLDTVHDKIQHLLEVELPLGMRVYRDEDSSMFIVPQLANIRDSEVKQIVAERLRQLLKDEPV
jgi:hypothetical protein